MPVIVDYTSLAKAITDVSHRQDIIAYQDYFIQAAMEKIQNDIFDQNFGNGLKIQENPFTAQNISATGTVPVPSDWLAPKYMAIADGAGNVFTLVFKDPQWILDVYSNRQAQGLPAYIARDNSGSGEVFIFGPYPDSSYQVTGTYYQEATLLSTQNPTNWMTNNCPWALHAACMIEVGQFLVNDQLIARWTPVYAERIRALIDADKAERWAAATMRVEIA